VLTKELRDGLRDRRSLMSALLFPLFGPVLIAIMFTSIVEDQASERPLEVPIDGAEHAPGLVEYLQHRGVVVQDPPLDPQNAVIEGDVPMVLIIPADYEESFRSGRSVSLELVTDHSRRDAEPLVQRLRIELEGYSAKIGTLRLLARGVHPEVVRPLTIRDLDVSTPQRRAANLVNVVPMFAMLAAFIGGMFLATDGTAGERERKSFEPLLLNPVSRYSLAAGKWIATVCLSLVSATVTLVGSGIALAQVPLHKIGLSLQFGPADFVAMFAAVLPLCLFAAGVQLVVASFARSFREAQTYLSLLTLLPTLPGVLLLIKPLKTEVWMLVIPVLGQQTLFMDVLRGEATAPWMFGVTGGSALLLASAAVATTGWLFSREKTLFGE
jgi:sodium transport system permease protein